MKAYVKDKLESLQIDYSQIWNQPFNHFYCPILFTDEDVSLCKAHIVNKAFPNSSREWTIQREDVDNFYGSNFEADFLAIQHVGKWSPGEVIVDKNLQRMLDPRIVVNDQQVDYFIAQDDVPEHFTRMEFDSDGHTVQLGLKMSPDEVLSSLEKSWDIEISKDMRLPALVSLIKAAHLTLFAMRGYRYALSAGGYFVGRSILGEFFLKNRGKSKTKVLESALPFFREFTHMVRPVQSSEIDLKGTITDQLLLLCNGKGNSRWAMIVFVKTVEMLHAVMIPIFDQPDSVARFMGFLKNDYETIEVNFCRFKNERWGVDETIHQMPWPKQSILYP